MSVLYNSNRCLSQPFSPLPLYLHLTFPHHVNAALPRAGLLVWRISGLAADQLVLKAANLTRP